MEQETKLETLPENKKSSQKGFSIATGILNSLTFIFAAIFTPITISIFTSKLEANKTGDAGADAIAQIIIAFLDGIGKALVIALLIVFIIFSVVNFILSLLGMLKNKKCGFLVAMLILSSLILAVFVGLLIASFILF